jgi:DNA-binding CsgD family transcriptional regulator
VWLTHDRRYVRWYGAEIAENPEMSGVGARLVGRERESAEALAFLDRATEGPGGLVLEGAPGIGKTTVWRAALDEARARGFRTLTCAGDQAETRFSLAGVGDLLDGVADDELALLPTPQREALERAALRRSGSRDVETDAQQIGVSLRSLLVGLAATAPVLVAVDDAQWLDRASAAALAFAVRRLRPHHVGVLVTVRLPAPSGDPLGLARALGDDGTMRVQLGPLTADELHDLIAARLQFDYPEPVMAGVAAATVGNPLFALEVARALGPTPTRLHDGRLPVPEGLREVVRARVGTLGAPGREALLAAAELAHADVETVERAASGDGLAEAEEAGLVRVDGARVVFEHPLYAAAVYDTASTRRRRAMHVRLADLVADDEERARHLALGAVPPDERIASALEAGAKQARARGAMSAAAELFELARKFTPETAPDARRERGVRAAEHHIHAGEFSAARLLLDEVFRGPTTRALRCEALQLLAQVHGSENGFVAARECLEEALEFADTPAERIAIHLPLADWLSATPVSGIVDFAPVALHTGLAVREAEALGDPEMIAEALAVDASVGFLAGHGIDHTAIERALALEDPEYGFPVYERPHMGIAMLELWDDRFDEAREHLNALRRYLADVGDEAGLGDAMAYLSWVEGQVGDFSSAISIAETVVQDASVWGNSVSKAWALGSLTFLHGVRGDVPSARAAAAETQAICELGGFSTPLLWATAGLGTLELSLGDPAAAWAATREMTEALERAPNREPAVHHYLPSALEALIQIGELDRAERLIAWIEERTRVVEIRSSLAYARHARGLLLAERGDLEGADRALSDSLERFELLGMPFEAAHTLLSLGRVRRRRRQRVAARDVLGRALVAFDGLGAPLWAERTRDELARLPHAPSKDALTETERRVAALATEGLSNKEIAHRLFVTVSTVEVHLSHTYAKLGVHSRTGLAAVIRDGDGAVPSLASDG